METISLDVGPLMWAVWIAAGALLVLVASAWLVIYRLGEILDEMQATRAGRDALPSGPAVVSAGSPPSVSPSR